MQRCKAITGISAERLQSFSGTRLVSLDILPIAALAVGWHWLPSLLRASAGGSPKGREIDTVDYLLSTVCLEDLMQNLTAIF